MPPNCTAFFFAALCFCTSLLVHAQNISTSIPVPPLQWINLSNLLQGSSGPPPLRDASIGYDENRYIGPSTLVSALTSILQSVTHRVWRYIAERCCPVANVSVSKLLIYTLHCFDTSPRQFSLNLDSLTWSTPVPPLNLKRTPPARSLALSGVDFAASKSVFTSAMRPIFFDNFR